MENKETLETIKSIKNAEIYIEISINNAEWKIGQYEQKIEDLKAYIAKLNRIKEGIK